MKKIAIQLYSVRGAIEELGFERVLDELAKMGFTGVEFAGVGDVKKEDMKRYLDNAGLEAVGSHSKHNILINDLDKEMEYMGYLGCKYITCPSAPVNKLSQINKTINDLNTIGRKVTENGFVFSYHNHAPELWLTVNGGKRALDYIFENTDADFVKAQLDVFHVLRADVNPYEYVEKYAHRMPTIHLKQMESSDTKEDARAGKGVIDFRRIIDIASLKGTLEYIYEDEGVGDQLEMAKESCEYLLKI
ncbi:MAG: sugar phosphate isomerase/epimerase [Ruminococcaceae bacterium]|nr:sugar phosphate isomerase/epimerase [Oscillospiraceae bacterium]